MLEEITSQRTWYKYSTDMRMGAWLHLFEAFARSAPKTKSLCRLVWKPRLAVGNCARVTPRREVPLI